MTKVLLLLGIILCGAAHAHAEQWRVLPVSSLQKLTAKSPGELEPFAAKPAQLRAAGGEWECFQIVVKAGDKALNNVQLKATPLATHLGHFILPKNIEIYRENFVFVDQPSGNKRLEKLWWPDALLPVQTQTNITVAPRKSEVFWVAVQAPREAATGEYFGAIDVTADGEKPRSLFVALNVDKTVMPAPTMRANVAVYYDILKDWYAKHLNQAFDETLKQKYFEFLLDYRINAYDLPVDWSDPQAAEYLKDPRVLSVRLPSLDNRETFDKALKVLRANNALHKAYYYWIDEPSPDDFARVKEATAKLRAIDPNIKHCVTVHPNQSLQGAVDIWCPNIGDHFGLGHLDTAMLTAERKKGKETWWYTMVEPKYPYPTWLLDDDAMSVRIYGALMARYGITGFVYSMAHGWGPKPLENLQSYAGTNGDGTLLYPSEIVGGSGPMPSIRLMLLRDAIEDYELMRTAKRKLEKLPGGLLRARIQPAKVSIPYRHADPQFSLSHDQQTLFVKFTNGGSTLEKDWCAIELAPSSSAERYRFVVTAKGNGIVEKHSREGRFRIEGFAWKFAAKKAADGYEVEMQIPLTVVNNEKQFRFNALRRIGGSDTPIIVRAFPDAGDITLMPLAVLGEPGA